jgi:hypothetical protein
MLPNSLLMPYSQNKENYANSISAALSVEQANT